MKCPHCLATFRDTDTLPTDSYTSIYGRYFNNNYHTHINCIKCNEPIFVVMEIKLSPSGYEDTPVRRLTDKIKEAG